MSLPEAVRVAAWLGGAAAGAAVAREDWRRSKVPNAALAALAALAAAGWAALGLAGFPLRDALVHAAAAAAGGLGLWRLGVWPAGDAKLFIVLAWLVPLAEPSLPLGWGRSALALLMNVFVPAGTAFLAASLAWLWHSRLRHDAGFARQLGWEYARDYLRQRGAALAARAAALRPEPRALAEGLLDAAAMAGAGAALLSRLAPGAGPWAALGFVLAWDGAGRLAGRWFLRLAAAAAVVLALRFGLEAALFLRQAGLWLAFGLCLRLGTAAAAGLLGGGERLLPALALLGPLVGLAPWLAGRAAGAGAWVWWGASGGVAYWLAETFLEEDTFTLGPERVEAGLVPAAPLLAAAGADAGFFARHLSRRYPDGLTARQARALRGWARRRGLAELSFKRTRPFAPWILLGAALTALLRRDVLSALRGLP